MNPAGDYILKKNGSIRFCSGPCACRVFKPARKQKQAECLVCSDGASLAQSPL
jgi:hypothetical protein